MPEYEKGPHTTDNIVGVARNIAQAILRTNPTTWRRNDQTAVETDITVGGKAKKEKFDITTISIPNPELGEIKLATFTNPKKAETADVLHKLVGNMFPKGDPIASIFSDTRPDIYLVQCGKTFIQGAKAAELVEAAEEVLKTVSRIASEYLTSLGNHPEKAAQLSWHKEMSEDEKVTTYTAEKDGFVIEVRREEYFELLERKCEQYVASISLNDTLVGPITVNGSKVEALFKAIAGSPDGDEEH